MIDEGLALATVAAACTQLTFIADRLRSTNPLLSALYHRYAGELREAYSVLAARRLNDDAPPAQEDER